MKAAAVLVVFGLLSSGRCHDAFQDDASAGDQEDGPLIAHLNEDNMVEIEDMVLTWEQFQEIFQPDVSNVLGRRGLATTSSKWPGGVVPYEFAAGLQVSQTAIRAAMNEWEKQTCVRFIPKRPTDTAFVTIKDGVGCSSNVGFTGKAQVITLAKGCSANRVIMHELGHTLGLHHEHIHPDRDKHVKIIWDNITDDQKKAFMMKPSGAVTTYGFPYDPYSIMHYEAMAFKNCQNCKTIEPLNPNLLTVIGKSQQLSPKSDIPIMKKMYSCKR